MPKRKDINKVMVIGSGPIVIGQAAEFDYAGTQACMALKEEGYEVVLANSNPATIMTDTHIADKVYMEPLTLEYVAKIIRYERPDAIVPGLGGQTGLNLAVQLAKKGILKECQVEILGTSFESIERAEDRELFKELCEELGEPVLPSEVASSIDEATSEGSTGSPSSSHSSLNSSRSSARSIDSNDVPRISTWHSFRMPFLASCTARFRPVWPPSPGTMASGRS